jgi:hypothetical protein
MQWGSDQCPTVLTFARACNFQLQYPPVILPLVFLPKDGGQHDEKLHYGNGHAELVRIF